MLYRLVGKTDRSALGCYRPSWRERNIAALSFPCQAGKRKNARGPPLRGVDRVCTLQDGPFWGIPDILQLYTSNFCRTQSNIMKHRAYTLHFRGSGWSGNQERPTHSWPVTSQRSVLCPVFHHCEEDDNELEEVQKEE